MQKSPALTRLWNDWKALLRVLLGVYWLYFSSQKWFDISWVKPILEEAARTNPVPLVSIALSNVVIPNWQSFTILQTVTEAAIGALLLIGFLTRFAGTLGAILGSTLLLTFLGALDAPVFAWFYIFTATSSLTVATSDSGKRLGIDQFLERKYPNPPLGLW
jgi:uncharacterized membrane protein YphA (DoxX/SURF4 family)